MPLIVGASWCLESALNFRVGAHSLGAVGVHLVVLPHKHDKPGTHANNFHTVGYYILLAFYPLFLHFYCIILSTYILLSTHFAIDGNYPSKVHTEAVRSQSSR